MQSYFDRIKGSAIKAAQQVAVLSSALTKLQPQQNNGNLSIATSSSSSNGISVPASVKSAEEAVIYHFQTSCEIMDSIGEMDDPYSAEADRLLHSSKAKDHLKAMVALLQDESDVWYQNYNNVNSDPDATDLGCLTTLLQTYILHALCNRACRDIPRGTLPLTLGVVAFLLRNVRYPLLPHQSVHKPISHLVTVAWQYEVFHSDYANIQSKSDVVSYRKRIDIGLTSLLSILWRKISDNPPIINAFKLSDFKQRAQSETGSPGEIIEIKPQIDILSSLIALMFKEKIGPHARDSLAVALSMHDVRIDAFLLFYGHFVEIAIDELCRRFELLLQFMSTENSVFSKSISQLKSQQNKLEYVTPTKDKSSSAKISFGFLGIHGMDPNDVEPLSSPPGPSPVGPRSSGFDYQPTVPSKQSESTLSIVESFLEILKFIDIVMEACSARPVVDVYKLGINFLDADGVKPLPLDNTATTIKSRLRDLYKKQFITEYILPSLTSTSEQQVVNSNGAVTLLLETMAYSNSKSSLLLTTVRMMIGVPDSGIAEFSSTDSSEILSLLSSRCGSISKPVAISSLRLLSTLVKTSPMLEALYITNNTCVQLNKLLSSSNDNSSPVTLLDKTLSVDDIIDSLANFSINSNSDNIVSSQNNSPKSNSEFKKMIFSVDSEKDILLRIQAVSLSVSGLPIAASTSRLKLSLDTSSIISLLIVKIDSFLTLSLEEQLSVATLLGNIACVLCGNIVLQNKTDKALDECIQQELAVLYQFLSRLDAVWVILSSQYLPRIPQLDWKFQVVQHILAKAESADKYQPPRPPQALRASLIENAGIQYIRMLEAESPQTKRILESAVIVKSSFMNIQSHLNSVKRLNFFFQSQVINSGTDQILSSPILLARADAIDAASLDDDLFEILADEEEMSSFKQTFNNTILKAKKSNETQDTKESFLEEIIELENTLQGLVGN